VSGTLARAYGSNLLALNLCLLYSQASRFSVRLKQEVLSNLAGSDPLPVSNHIFRIPGASRNLPAGFAAIWFSTCWFPVTDLTFSGHWVLLSSADFQAEGRITRAAAGNLFDDFSPAFRPAAPRHALHSQSLQCDLKSERG
jgi:hypothetical protein